jgi:hypothetical protein
MFIIKIDGSNTALSNHENRRFLSKVIHDQGMTRNFLDHSVLEIDSIQVMFEDL